MSSRGSVSPLCQLPTVVVSTVVVSTPIQKKKRVRRNHRGPCLSWTSDVHPLTGIHTFLQRPEPTFNVEFSSTNYVLPSRYVGPPRQTRGDPTPSPSSPLYSLLPPLLLLLPFPVFTPSLWVRESLLFCRVDSSGRTTTTDSYQNGVKGVTELYSLSGLVARPGESPEGHQNGVETIFSGDL